MTIATVYSDLDCVLGFPFIFDDLQEEIWENIQQHHPINLEQIAPKIDTLSRPQVFPDF